MNVTAVAQPRAASTKNCQGWRPASGFSRTFSVEVSELIVDALLEGRVDGDVVFWRVGLARPLHGGEAERRGPRCAQQVRHQPRQAVEPLVDRRAEHI